MALPFSILLSLFLLLSFSTSSTSTKPPKNLVQTSCAQASYPNICLRTLSSYSGPTNSLRDLAQAAVKVSISKSHKASDFLTKLKAHNKREQGALGDCVQQMAESVDELTKTLSELQNLRRAGSEFEWHLSNAKTWVSAALTYEDTCLDGFKEIDGKIRSDVKMAITNVAKVTSNALYLINRLDTSSGKN